MRLKGEIIKKSIICILCLLTFRVFATTWYVAATGSDSNNGSIDSPWLTVAFALARADSGDTVSIGNGIYDCPQLFVSHGVSLISTSRDKTKVTIQPVSDMNLSTPLVVLDSAPGSSGNQSISYLTFNGKAGSVTAATGLMVANTNHVRIHHNSFLDFTSTQNNWDASLVFKSTEIPFTSQWSLYWPNDPTDEDIDALWPINPMEDLEFDNNEVIRCNAIKLYHLKNASIHHNYVDNRLTAKEAFHGTCAFMDGVDIHDNTLLGKDVTTGTNWRVELWMHRNGCKYRNNIMNGYYSITVGKDTEISGNTIYRDVVDYGYGVGIEFNMQSNGLVYGNYVADAGTGLFGGINTEANRDFITRDITVRNNVFYSIANYCIRVNCAGQYGKNVVVEDIYVYNNTIDGTLGRGTTGISLHQEDVTDGSSIFRRVNVKNNIVKDQSGYAGRTIGFISQLTITHNLFFNNGYNRWDTYFDSNTFTNDPGFVLEGAGYDGYTPTNTPPIDSGIIDSIYSSFGVGYEGAAPDIGAIEVAISSTTGIVTNITTDKFCFYPNPVRDVVTISGNQDLNNYSLEVFTIYGDKLYQKKGLIGTPFRLDMSGYTSGMYVIKLSDSNNRHITGKVIKE